MRIPSGKIDQTLAFVAQLAGSRVTGLTGFTVYRSRNGGAATAYTTPTVAELSAANMPGVYVLTVDEDTTIAATSDSEEMVLHITATGMDPVTRVVELYRNVVTSGQTLSVSGGGLGAIAANVIDAGAVAADAVSEIQSGLATEANATANATGLAGTLTTIAGYIDTEVAAIKAKTDNLPADPADASDIAARFATLDSNLATVDGVVGAIKAKTDGLSFTIAGQVDANIQSVNDIEVTGTGASGSEWGPA